MNNFFEEFFGSDTFGEEDTAISNTMEETISAEDTAEDEAIEDIEESVEEEESTQEAGTTQEPAKEAEAEDDFSFASFFGENDGFGLGGKAKGKPAAKEKKEKKKDEKKASKKATGDMEVELPLTVRGRNFSFEVAAESGCKKLSDIWKLLLKEGYEQLNVSGFRLCYSQPLKIVFVADNAVLATDGDAAVLEKPEDQITVCDGHLKAVIKRENLDKDADDDVSLSEVSDYFASINPLYEGCKLALSGSVAYPVFSEEADEKAFAGVTSFVKEGVEHLVAEETVESLKNAYGNPGCVTVSLKMGGKGSVFVSYISSSQYYTITVSGGVTAKPKKVEPKYSLPLDVMIANWGGTYRIEEFEGKSKITLDEVKKALSDKHKIFKDSSRRMDHYYDEDKNLLSVMFMSGQKGCELIRTMEEFEQAKALTDFDGVFCEGITGGSVRLRTLPTGYLLTKLGKETPWQEVDHEWFYRYPRIPIRVLKAVVSYFREDLTEERAVRIFYNPSDGRFFMKTARGEKSKARIHYFYDYSLAEISGWVLMADIHSHNTMPAFFSSVDDADERNMQGVFGVIGNLHERPKMQFRVVRDEKFFPIGPGMIFEARPEVG